MTGPIPPPKTRHRRAVEAEIATLRNVSQLEASIGRSRQRIEQVAKLLLARANGDAGVVISGSRYYWPDEVDAIAQYIKDNPRKGYAGDEA